MKNVNESIKNRKHKSSEYEVSDDDYEKLSCLSGTTYYIQPIDPMGKKIYDPRKIKNPPGWYLYLLIHNF